MSVFHHLGRVFVFLFSFADQGEEISHEKCLTLLLSHKSDADLNGCKPSFHLPVAAAVFSCPWKCSHCRWKSSLVAWGQWVGRDRGLRHLGHPHRRVYVHCHVVFRCRHDEKEVVSLEDIYFLADVLAMDSTTTTSTARGEGTSSARRRSERLGKKHHSYESFLTVLDNDDDEDDEVGRDQTAWGGKNLNRKSLKRKSSSAKVQRSSSLERGGGGCQSSKGEKTLRQNSSDDSDSGRVMVPTGRSKIFTSFYKPY